MKPHLGIVGASLIAISWAGMAGAQGAPSLAETSQDIIVTGTSLRGVAPVGGNLVSVGRTAIDDTGAFNTQQILKTVPAITGIAYSGIGQNVGNSYYAPTIHSLGASASNSTLILIDGHRIPLGHTSLALPDPSIVPTIAIERVDVLAEGASSIYGSDAVAGVVNFITRKSYDGIQATGQVGFGLDFETYSAGLIGGTSWSGGNFYVAFGYSHSGNVAYNYEKRPFLYPDHRDQGGDSFLSFNCSPATVQPAGQSLIFNVPGRSGGYANSPANATCNTQPYGDLIGKEWRYNGMARVEQQVTDSLTLSGNFIYSDRRTLTNTARGGIQATVFGPGSSSVDQINPFFTQPDGYSGGATRQTIRWQADELLGPGAYNDNTAQTWTATGEAEYRFGNDFRATAMFMYGQDRTQSLSEGQLCSSCAALALNGTTLAGGDPTIRVAGTTLLPLNMPLTADTALDVWNPVSSNRTSDAVRKMLSDSRVWQSHISTIRQVRVGVDGPLFELPAGPARIALGGELQKWVLDTTLVRPQNTGPSSTGSSQRLFPLGRNVKSLYGELQVPLVAPDSDSFVYRVDVNVSARYDDYSDFGDTFNPKFAANIEFAEGIKLRGNWAKSFVAPSLRSVGNEFGTYNNSTAALINPNVLVSRARFPEIADLPGIQAAGLCDATACRVGGNYQGIVVDTGNPNVGPQKGTTWSLGLDFAPPFAPGLRASATLFTNRIRGGITSPCAPGCILNNGALNYLFTVYPAGATQAQIDAKVNDVPITTAFPSTVYFIFMRPQTNALDLDVQGLDLMAGYEFDTEIGTFDIGGSVTQFLSYKQAFGGGAQYSILNTVGINATFPAISRQGRAHIGWNSNGFGATFYANHVGSYKNWGGGTINPIVLDANGNPASGGDRIAASTTFDLHLSYTMPDGGILGGTDVYLDSTNVFNQTPPFFNTATGYGGYGANPLGRVINVGVRAKF